MTAVRRWASELAAAAPHVRRVGYFGSFSRGDWGVGSDVDLVVVVEHADEPFPRRAARFDATGLPVPADIVVYTTDEWERVSRGGMITAAAETVWIFPAPADRLDH